MPFNEASLGGVVAHQYINSNYLYGSFDYRLGHCPVTAERRVRFPHEPPIALLTEFIDGDSQMEKNGGSPTLRVEYTFVAQVVRAFAS